MSGRYRGVLLRKVEACTRCGASKTAQTHPTAGTVISPSCDPYRCPIAKVIELAGSRPARWEPLPIDDRGAA